MQHLSSAVSYSGFYVGCVIVVTKKRRSDGDNIGDMNPHEQVNSECEDDVHLSPQKKYAGLQILFATVFLCFCCFWYVFVSSGRTRCYSLVEIEVLPDAVGYQLQDKCWIDV